MATFSSKNPKFTEEEKRRIVEGTDDRGMPLSDREKVKLENMFTSRVLGDDWRKRLKDKDPNKEQKALDTFLDINKNPQYESPLQETVTNTKIKTPSGGSVQYGIDTLARMRNTEAQNKAQEVARREKFNTSLVSMQQNAANTLKKRYEDELASRGFAPPQNRQEQEAIDKARMEDFRAARKSNIAAERAEKTALVDYSNYKAAARQARLNNDFGRVAYYENEASKINNAVGGDIKNVTSRRSFLKDQANKDLINEINARTEDRKQKTQKQTISNPEASSFIPQSTNAPIGAGYDSLSYESRARPIDATEQPFGLITPDKQNNEVDFSRISQYNTTQSNASKYGVSGASEKMPIVQMNPNETASQYNARLRQEYINNVIIPSFDETTQKALISATELNKLEPKLFRQRLTTPEKLKEHTEVSKKLKEDRKVIVKTMNQLKSKARDYNKIPANSKERSLVESQIEALRSQLGFFDDLLN
jgi:hypothetical protein